MDEGSQMYMGAMMIALGVVDVIVLRLPALRERLLGPVRAITWVMAVFMLVGGTVLLLS